MAKDMARAADRFGASAGYRVARKERAVLRGHLRVVHEDGTVLLDHDNMIVDDGLEALVDCLVTGSPVLNVFKYVGFGTSAAASAAGDAALTAEISGGSYARLTGTQAEGDNAKEARVSGTWTNNSAGSQDVNEYGLFSLASGGVMFARVSSGDAGGPVQKTVAVGETITVTWDFAWADA